MEIAFPNCIGGVLFRKQSPSSLINSHTLDGDNFPKGMVVQDIHFVDIQMHLRNGEMLKSFLLFIDKDISDNISTVNGGPLLGEEKTFEYEQE